MTKVFNLELEVRDYECDIQGIVNNSVYLNYLEHTRHSFIKSINLNFQKLCNKNINIVLAKLECRFLIPLKSNDVFNSKIEVSKLNLPLIYLYQYLSKNNLLIFKAHTTLACTDQNFKLLSKNQLLDIENAFLNWQLN